MAKAIDREQALAERLTQARAEANEFIDAQAEKMKAEAPGVPVGVLRQLIEASGGGCPCRQALIEIKKQKKQNA